MMSAEHSEDDCTALCKMRLDSAHKYTNRLAHQRKKFALDEVVEDLEALKPPSEYDSSSEKEDPSALPAPPRPRARPRFRVRHKAVAPDHVG